MMGDQLTTLIAEDKIKEAVAQLGEKLGKELRFDKPPIFICVLKGASFFFADLIREYPHDCKVDFIGCSSYGSSTTSSGEVKITYDLSLSIKDENIVLVEDIVDTGYTLEFLQKFLGARKPESITTVTLLNKPGALKTDVKVDHSCFEIGNEFVVGYGLDFNDCYRNHNDIAVLTNTGLN
jgi:hypoxanthine phosphoribosyltransferase